MADHHQYIDQNLELTQAVYAIAFQTNRENTLEVLPKQEVLDALQLLAGAPAEDHWNRGLLMGLRCKDEEISKSTIDACIHRLKSLPGDEAKDQFLGAILDSCFLNLSGHPRYVNTLLHREVELIQHFNHLEATAAALLKAVSNHLLAHPLHTEHHRSRLLARARQIIHLEGSGDIARQMVDFQLAIAKEDNRSDNRTAALLNLYRKYEFYASPESTDSSLLAYLETDSSLPPEELSPELFQSYRFLLNYQSKERVPGALKKAINNLNKWLDSINPYNPENRQRFLEESQRAFKGIPWDDLSTAIRRNLEFHLELLPGPKHPEDLLCLLRKKYTSKEGEIYLAMGLELLQRLPLIRYRYNEISEFITEPARVDRGQPVWNALLNLLDSILTGLADFVITKSELDKEMRKQNLARQDLLKQDVQIRALLYRLSTDSKFKLSQDCEMEEWIRKRSWEVLLDSLPQDRDNLYYEGLIDHGQKFFLITIKAAQHHCQRVVWEILYKNWGVIIHSNLSPEHRKERITSICDYFQATRNYEAVQANPNQIGPLLEWALDEPDEELRQYAERAVLNAGYQLELQRERQRRELLRLRDQLTTSNNRIIELEKRIAQLDSEITATRMRRVEHTLNIQEQFQQRDIISTEGWINTSRFQVAIEQLQEDLADALARAREQSNIILQLQNQIRSQTAACRREYDHMERLVRDQQEYENERDRLVRQRENLEQRVNNLTNELSNAQSRMRSLANQRPAINTSGMDSDAIQRANDRLNSEINSWRNQIRRIENNIAGYESEITNARNQITSYTRQIAATEEAIRSLRDEINQQRARVHHLDQELVVLQHSYNEGQRIWQAIREEIDRLEQRLRRLEAEIRQENQTTRNNLEQNRIELERIQEQLNHVRRQYETLSQLHNQTTHELDNQETRSQQLAQAIDSGRENYDNIGENALQQSSMADTTGYSMEQRNETLVLEEQEYATHLRYNLNKSLQGHQSLPTKNVRKKRPSIINTTN